jgi:hypothetical protein
MAMRLASAALALLLAIGACQPSGESPDGSAEPASASPQPSASVSAEASISVELVGDGPVLDGPHVGQEFALPAALTYTDDAYHLFGVSFDEENSVAPRGFYATSADGIFWEIADDDPLAGIALDLTAPGPIPGSVLREDDGSWVMWFWGLPAPRERGGVLFRATAPAPSGPWTADPESVLEGTMGAWDGVGLDFPSVVHTEDGYLMVYAGSSLSAPNEGRLGVATSTDGMAWEKVEDPVIEPGLCGEFGSLSIGIPRLREVDEGYLLFYSGHQDDQAQGAAVGVASSADGLTWTCANPEPALTAADIPGSEGIHTIAVAAEARGPEFLVESLGDGSSLWLGDVSMTGLP